MKFNLLNQPDLRGEDKRQYWGSEKLNDPILNVTFPEGRREESSCPRTTPLINMCKKISVHPLSKVNSRGGI